MRGVNVADTIACKVIGPAKIDGVSAPDTVELDPEVTNVGALVDAGHIQLPKATGLEAADGAKPPASPRSGAKAPRES